METICRRRGVFLVDDAAQVAGISVDGQPLGTFGDVGLISFSQSKTIVAGSHNAGGLLIVNNGELESQLAAAHAALPEPRGSSGDVATFLWNYILAQRTELPTYYFGRIRRMVRATTARQAPTATRMSSLVAGLALEQLKSLPSRIEGRRRVVDLFHQKVSTQKEVEFPQFAPGRYLTRVVLALPHGCNLAEIRDTLRRNDVRTRSGYPVYGSELVRSPERALDLRPRLIELPSHSRMTAETVDKIWQLFETTITDARVRSEN
jgi:dTDP-4-amino-4,6-dideoxygalactose transaminase